MDQIEGSNEKNLEGQPEEKVVMEIIITKDGQVRVKSPILGDKAACYGILQVAQDAIREFHKPQIIRPNQHGIMNFIKNGKK